MSSNENKCDDELRSHIHTHTQAESTITIGLLMVDNKRNDIKIQNEAKRE